MANFEHNVMVALYWGDEIITEMNGFRYIECARMTISMSTSTNYVELVGLLHEKMETNSENIEMNISGKYPCSIQGSNTKFIEFKIENDQSLQQFFLIPQKFADKIDINILEMYVMTKSRNQNDVCQISGQHGFHMNLLAQNYEFATISQPHFAEPIIPPSFQQLSMRDHRPFGEGLNDDESEPDEDIIDIRDFSQNDIGINHSNRCEQDVPEMQNHDVPYFRTLENEEDIFMSTCESEMEHCSV
ncbi:hypothetical protein H5410_019718 [Solanum commersonii]|uniref:Uncharacterized protein n=1 Tax=Solanum commersonii TaxID=4109 RepID=A0A9J5Z863_SOLCO|nr:hypothetical protein H5410_019718 [Solanum commersonii]